MAAILSRPQYVKYKVSYFYKWASSACPVHIYFKGHTDQGLSDRKCNSLGNLGRTADGLAPCVTRESTAMVLAVQDEQVLLSMQKGLNCLCNLSFDMFEKW